MTHITEPDMTPSIGYRLVPVSVAEKVLPLVAKQVEICEEYVWIAGFADDERKAREQLATWQALASALQGKGVEKR